MGDTYFPSGDELSPGDDDDGGGNSNTYTNPLNNDNANPPDTFLGDLDAWDGVKKPANVVMEDSHGMTFQALYDHFKDAEVKVADDRLDAWHGIAQNITTAVQTFQSDLAKLDGKWRGKTYDAVLDNVQKSFAEPATAAKGAVALGNLLFAFSKTIFQTRWYVTENWPNYHNFVDLNYSPSQHDQALNDYDSFARAVMAKAYLPPIGQIREKNPGFTAGTNFNLNDPNGQGPGGNNPGGNNPGGNGPNGDNPYGNGPNGNGPNGNDPNGKGPEGNYPKPNGDGPGGAGTGGPNANLPKIDTNVPHTDGGSNPPNPHPPYVKPPGDVNDPYGDGDKPRIPDGDPNNPRDPNQPQVPDPNQWLKDYFKDQNKDTDPTKPRPPTDPTDPTSGLDGLQNAMSPVSDALNQAMNAAKKPGGPPEGVLGLGPKGISGLAKPTTPPAPHAGGGGAGLGGAGKGAGLSPAGAPTAASSKGMAPAAASRVGGVPGGGGTGGGGGGPSGGQRGADGKDHRAAKPLRNKKNGEKLVGEAGFALPVLGGEEPEEPKSDVAPFLPPPPVKPERT